MGNSLFDDGIQIKWIDEELPTEPIEQGYRKKYVNMTFQEIR